jgi:hypothetical protein
MWSRNTNTECVDLDQNIAGRWQADESGGSWRLSKDNQAWVLRPAASGRWVCASLFARRCGTVRR